MDAGGRTIQEQLPSRPIYGVPWPCCMKVWCVASCESLRIFHLPRYNQTSIDKFALFSRIGACCSCCVDASKIDRIGLARWFRFFKTRVSELRLMPCAIKPDNLSACFCAFSVDLYTSLDKKRLLVTVMRNCKPEAFSWVSLQVLRSRLKMNKLT